MVLEMHEEIRLVEERRKRDTENQNRHWPVVEWIRLCVQLLSVLGVIILGFSALKSSLRVTTYIVTHLAGNHC